MAHSFLPAAKNSLPALYPTSYLRHLFLTAHISLVGQARWIRTPCLASLQIPALRRAFSWRIPSGNEILSPKVLPKFIKARLFQPLFPRLGTRASNSLSAAQSARALLTGQEAPSRTFPNTVSPCLGLTQRADSARPSSCTSTRAPRLSVALRCTIRIGHPSELVSLPTRVAGEYISIDLSFCWRSTADLLCFLSRIPPFPTFQDRKSCQCFAASTHRQTSDHRLT
ncbi:hypothetical protein B0H15DRAFT_187701 [Mycena belliarum]|uniref:Uncharacterized protein n=1 Tax=Mycena belliarum TaxID=1033014 RepID=A0AAD6TNL0_9AGAR|nr:hypothetical protein B0H15DRAFT_187701 [Mycena belliae]